MPQSVVARQAEEAHLAFTLAAHRALSPDSTLTACWSPLSVASALGMLASGANGATQDELTTLLVGGPTGPLADHASLLAEATRLDHRPGEVAPAPTLGVSNTVWVRDDIPVRPEFVARLPDWPGGAVRNAPFTDDCAAARQLINDEVARTTRGLVTTLVPSSAITPDTVLALVNALYLKAAWITRFPERTTEAAPFHGVHTTVEVPTMRLVKQLGYAAVAGWRTVVLPAAGGVDAVVLLPDGPLAGAEAALDSRTLAGLLAAAVPTRVELFLPRFRVTAKSALHHVLEGLGVRTMFGPAADLSGISAAPLAVSAVLHEAVLTIDERGLEGAAATTTMTTLAMVARQPPPVVMRVDRPFLLLVRHRASGALYFVARVVQPR